MLLAITTGGKIGLGLAAGLLIVFAVAASFWLPRRNPDFPGERLGTFVAVAVLLFLVLMAAVVFFAKEEEEHPVAGEDGSTPAHTETEAGGGGGGAGGEETGDAAAGEDVFASTGCGSCHTLEAAGASGTVGPNLDEAKPDFESAVTTITNGRGAMPAFEGQLDEQQIRDVATFVSEEAG